MKKKKNAGSFATDGWMYGCHGFFLARITTEKKKKNFFSFIFFSWISDWYKRRTDICIQ